MVFLFIRELTFPLWMNTCNTLYSPAYYVWSVHFVSILVSFFVWHFWWIWSGFSLVWCTQFLQILFSARTSLEKCDHQFVSLFNTLTHENVRGVFTLGCQKRKVLLRVRRKIFCNFKKPTKPKPKQCNCKMWFHPCTVCHKSSFQAIPTNFLVSFSKCLRKWKTTK